MLVEAWASNCMVHSSTSDEILMCVRVLEVRCIKVFLRPDLVDTLMDCIMRRGKVPALVRELIKDTRKMMSPYTALKLKERKSNGCERDYVS